jgi:predicted CoA-binding protein
LRKAARKEDMGCGGSKRRSEKFGNRIYKKLSSRGYTVYPINPKYESIEVINATRT